MATKKSNLVPIKDAKTKVDKSKLVSIKDVDSKVDKSKLVPIKDKLVPLKEYRTRASKAGKVKNSKKKYERK